MGVIDFMNFIRNDLTYMYKQIKIKQTKKHTHPQKNPTKNKKKKWEREFEGWEDEKHATKKNTTEGEEEWYWSFKRNLELASVIEYD